MKTSLEHLPPPTRARLDRLAGMVRAQLPGVEAIILFGSYARGDFVADGQWRDYHPEPSRYHSDYDVAVLTAPDQSGKVAAARLAKVKRFFETEYGTDIPVQFHPFGVLKFNRMVKQHRFFFIDVVDEGILLYDGGRYALGEKRREPSYPLVLQWARHDWKQKRQQARVFRYGIDGVASAARREEYPLGTFMLHQYCECWYQAINLVLTEHQPKTHDLGKLRSMTLRHAPDELDAAFPLAHAADRRRFQLLCDGYVRGRYDRHFAVGKADFDALAAGAQRLAQTARRLCLARLREVARLAREHAGEPPPDGETSAQPDEPNRR